MPDRTHSIPPHILNNILGFLKPNGSYLSSSIAQAWKRDLLACSSVSKSWHTVALKYLFTNYALRFEGCDPTLEFDIQMGTYSSTQKNLRRFERFIKDSPAPFANLIERLSLVMARTTEGYNTYLDPTALRLMRLLNALTSLSILRLHDVCLNSVFETTPALFDHLPPVALSHLYISYSRRPVKPSQLLHLLSCFGVVSELHLEDFELDILSCDEITTDPSFLRVSSLFIWNMKNVRDLLYHFGSGTWTDCLESLYVAGIHLDGARMLSWLVYNLSSLRHLTFNLDTILDTLSFQMSLQSGFYFSEDPGDNRVIRQIAFALKTVRASPPALIELDFFVGKRLPNAFCLQKLKNCRPFSTERKSVRFADDNKENQAPHVLEDKPAVVKSILKRKREDEGHESGPKRIHGEEKPDKGEDSATVRVIENSMDTRKDRQDGDEGEEAPDKGKGRAMDHEMVNTLGDQQNGHGEKGSGGTGSDHTSPSDDQSAAPTPPNPSMTGPLRFLAATILRLSKKGMPNLRITLYTPPQNLGAALVDKRFLIHTLRNVLNEGRTKVECRCIVVQE